jgi:hypothetical protein
MLDVQSLMRFVHLGEQVRTKGGKLFTVQRIEEGPEPKVYTFSGPRDACEAACPLARCGPA